MRRTKRLLTRFICAAFTAACVVILANAPTASADALTGATYADAAAYITDTYKSTPVVATVVGDQLDKNDCIVASWSRSNFSDSSGSTPPNEILLNLNCYAKVASAGTPGNSLASPAGRNAHRDQQAAENIAKDPGFCEDNAENLAYCQRVCKRTGLCEV